MHRRRGKASRRLGYLNPQSVAPDRCEEALTVIQVFCHEVSDTPLFLIKTVHRPIYMWSTVARKSLDEHEKHEAHTFFAG